jgi:hydrogenase expression/formation protein HypC
MCLAIPGRILSIRGEDPLVRVGRIDFGGIVKDVCLTYTPEARSGEYVLVHVGFAMTVIDECEAQRILDELRAFACAESAPRSAAGAIGYDA